MFRSYWICQNGSMRQIIACIILIFFSLTAAFADDDDWRKLHEDVKSGKIKPLSEILDNLARDYIGQVIDVDIDDDDGERVYEIELLGPQGQVVEFEVDAVTGELIGIEGRNINGMTRP